ncbi:ABC transporter permease subunit [Candidatus Woesearchaeota archaeon]|nr:ABC transporter permease subunit [Candidatus Woesearchaeota archaeon]
MNRIKEVGIVLWSELKQASRDRKILIIIAIYVILLGIGMKQSVTLSQTFSASLFRVFLFSRTPIPYELLLFYFVSIAALPLFSLMLSYDSISGGISNMTIRNLAVRVKRSSIITGKFLAQVLTNASVNLTLYLMAALYMFWETRHLMLSQTLQLWIYLTVFMIYFTSLGLLMSNITTKPHRSLYIGVALIIGLIFVSSYESVAWMSPYNYYINGFHILAGNTAKVAESIISMLGFSALFFGASFFIFRRRDL